VRAGGPFKSRGFRYLLIGQGVSALGDWMGTIAFMALALQLTGSPTAVGGILTLRLLPAAIGGPLATRAVNKWDRRRTMLTMDLVRVVLIALVPLVRAIWWIYLWAFLVEVASIVFLPARDASIPDLVDEEDFSLANGLVLGSSFGTIPLGAGLFAAVAALPFADLFGRPLALVFWVDAATFLVSFACIARLTMLSRPAGPLPEAEQVKFREAFRIPLVRTVLPAVGAVALGLGALFSLGIVFVQDVLKASDTDFGVLIALFGVGAAIGLGVLWLRRGRDPISETRLGVAAIGGVIAVFSLASAVWIAFIGATAFGAAAAFTLSSGMGALQSRLEGNARVGAFAVFHVVIRLALGVAAIAAGLAGDLLGDVKWPWVGRLEPSRVVLLCSGLLVVAVSTVVREHALPESGIRSGEGAGSEADESDEADEAGPGAEPESTQEATA
jgi:predicted MFS family arabinose efflux permease